MYRIWDCFQHKELSFAKFFGKAILETLTLGLLIRWFFMKEFEIKWPLTRFPQLHLLLFIRPYLPVNLFLSYRAPGPSPPWSVQLNLLIYFSIPCYWFSEHFKAPFVRFFIIFIWGYHCCHQMASLQQCLDSYWDIKIWYEACWRPFYWFLKVND